jgi:ADP-ribose pyrophosphatase YjhB (NUDIX family)
MEKSIIKKMAKRSVRRKVGKPARKKKCFCSNCGEHGHIYRECTEPITSLGFITFKINSSDSLTKLILEKMSTDSEVGYYENVPTISVDDLEDFTFYKGIMNFLLIRRRDSLGFLEFIRGRYDINNVDGITFLFQQMTEEEIKRFKTQDFDTMWNNVWKTPYSHQKEYKKSKDKFQRLKEGKDVELKLDFYVENVEPIWECPEWGFPKGRRNGNESGLDCAKREFTEETGLKKEDYIYLSSFPEMVETFTGTNGIKYRHIYYIGLAKDDVKLEQDKDNGEIGDMTFLPYEDAMNSIRQYHTEKKRVLAEQFMRIMQRIISIKKKILLKYNIPPGLEHTVDLSKAELKKQTKSNPENVSGDESDDESDDDT